MEKSNHDRGVDGQGWCSAETSDHAGLDRGVDGQGWTSAETSDHAALDRVVDGQGGGTVICPVNAGDADVLVTVTLIDFATVTANAGASASGIATRTGTALCRNAFGRSPRCLWSVWSCCWAQTYRPGSPDVAMCAYVGRRGQRSVVIQWQEACPQACEKSCASTKRPQYRVQPIGEVTVVRKIAELREFSASECEHCMGGSKFASPWALQRVTMVMSSCVCGQTTIIYQTFGGADEFRGELLPKTCGTGLLVSALEERHVDWPLYMTAHTECVFGGSAMQVSQWSGLKNPATMVQHFSAVCACLQGCALWRTSLITLYIPIIRCWGVSLSIWFSMQAHCYMGLDPGSSFFGTAQPQIDPVHY